MEGLYPIQRRYASKICPQSKETSMTNNPQRRESLSWKGVFFLSVIFPLFLLLLLECLFRVVTATGIFASEKDRNVTLEMPSWMVPGTTKPKAFSESEIEWMSNFQSGNGFRVHMKPSRTFAVVDTFSWKERNKPIFTVTSNSAGFRGSNFSSTKPDGTIRIVAFGDSSTFGWGVNDDDTYLSRLITDLSKRYPERNFELINFAMPGDSSEFGKLIFDRFIDEIAPDIAIFGFGANDARLATLPHRQAVELFTQQGVLQRARSFLLRNSELIKRLSQAISQGGATPLGQPQKKQAAVSIKEFRENLRYFQRRSKNAGAHTVIFVSACTPASYQKAMRKVAENKETVYVPAQALLRKAIPNIQQGSLSHPELESIQKIYGSLLKRQPVLYVTSDACHPNIIGHTLINEHMMQLLLDNEAFLSALTVSPAP